MGYVTHIGLSHREAAVERALSSTGKDNKHIKTRTELYKGIKV